MNISAEERASRHRRHERYAEFHGEDAGGITAYTGDRGGGHRELTGQRSHVKSDRHGDVQ